MKRKIMLWVSIILTMLAVSFCPDNVSAKDSDGDFVVIIDPGHGGKDGGACQNGLVEKELNWNIAVALKAELETYSGVKVYLTRGYGEWNSNTGRGRFGNNLGADLFISCHNNSGSNNSSRGAMVYGTVNATYGPSMKKLGNMILEKLSEAGFINSGYQQRPSTDDVTVDFYTALDEAVKAGIPGLIIEHCYINNVEDAAFIAVTENQYKAGAADAAAVAEYLGLQKRQVNAKSDITLTRTYSAQFAGVSGTFKSSDSNVAYVSENGLITAVSEGTAKITCIDSDGNKHSLNVTVPRVVQIGVAAGTNPTFFDGMSAAENFNRSKVMIKAIYSDGQAIQVNGTIGEIKNSVDGIRGALDVEVSYGGYYNYLRIYNYYVPGATDNDNNIPSQDNKDILLIPGSYSYTSNPVTVQPATEPEPIPTEPVTVPTEPEPMPSEPETDPSESGIEETIRADDELMESETDATVEENTIVESQDMEDISEDDTESGESMDVTLNPSDITLNDTNTTDENDPAAVYTHEETRSKGLRILKTIIIIIIILCFCGVIVCIIIRH